MPTTFYRGWFQAKADESRELACVMGSCKGPKDNQALLNEAAETMEGGLGWWSPTGTEESLAAATGAHQPKRQG